MAPNLLQLGALLRDEDLVGPHLGADAHHALGLSQETAVTRTGHAGAPDQQHFRRCLRIWPNSGPEMRKRCLSTAE